MYDMGKLKIDLNNKSEDEDFQYSMNKVTQVKDVSVPSPLPFNMAKAYSPYECKVKNFYEIFRVETVQ